jgi:soluble lytic murein transglycosylase-like protein
MIARRWSAQDDFAAILDGAADRYGLPAALLYAITGVESGFNPRAQSGSGSLGLMQITPSTATGLGYTGTAAGLFDPWQNVELGAKLLAQLNRRLGGNAAKMASAYNGGVRPDLGFGEPLTKALRLCLAWADPAHTKCAQWYDAKSGEFGNQPYVVKVLSAYGYFAQYLAERDGAPAPAPVPGVPTGQSSTSPSWPGYLLGAGLAGAALYLLRRFF